MMIKRTLFVLSLCCVLSLDAAAAILTVTTTNNVSPPAGQMSLLQALGQVGDGDEIRFNIPGTGPHYLATPPEGYPIITRSNVTINGYSQPGSSPNTNSILAPNNARIQIVLDSRAGGHRVMTFPMTAPNDDRGYDEAESAVLGIADAQGFHVQGLSFLGVPQVGDTGDVALYFISFGRGASGHINGCWLGVDPDGTTVAGAANGVTGFRYRGRDSAGQTTNTVLINDVIIGVEPNATNAVQQFNVIVGMPAIPIIIEGANTRISGNFITVLPDGLRDYNVSLDDNLTGNYEGSIEIGRSGNNTLIGTDGDGVNDENERNVFGGAVPRSLGGYPHMIEFYGQDPGTNIVIAGNYIGVGIDGQTRFTNGIPFLNAAGAAAEYRIGSNLDGVSDALEANLIANNYPADLFPPSSFQETPESLSFFSQLNAGATISFRGNRLINNFPFPASPLRDDGLFLVNYYSRALLDGNAGVAPMLETNSTRVRLIGATPLTDPTYPTTTIDVYIADPAGIATGMAAEIPELPQGFVQGLEYLGSFVAGSAADLNPQPGLFEFDISSLNVPVGAQLTVTANFSGTVGGGGGNGDAPEISGIVADANGITITWEGAAIVESAPAVTGPWTEESTTGNSFTTAPSGSARFFRLQAGGTGPGGVATLPLTSPFSNVVEVR